MRQLHTVIPTTLLLLAVALTSGCSQDELWGSPDDDDDSSSGIPVFRPEDPATAGRTLFGVNRASGELFRIDIETGEFTFLGPLSSDPGQFTTPVALSTNVVGAVLGWNNRDPSDGAMANGRLLRIDGCTGNAFAIPRLEPQSELECMAAVSTRMFGVGPARDAALLFEINLQSGVLTAVAATVPIPLMGGMDTDANGEVFCITRDEQPLTLYTIDVNSSTLQEVTTVGGEIVRADAMAIDGDGVAYVAGEDSQERAVLFALTPQGVTDVRELSAPVDGMVFATAECP